MACKSFGELAYRLADRAATNGLIDRRLCRMTVIANDIYSAMMEIDWYLYIVSRTVDMSNEMFWLLCGLDSVNIHGEPVSSTQIDDYRWDYQRDIEDTILDCMHVMSGDFIRFDRVQARIDTAGLRIMIYDFVHANAMSIRKL